MADVGFGVSLRPSPKGDGKLRCFRCNGRFPPHLMHRVVFDKLQDPAARAKRDRDTKPVWQCPDCWRQRFAATFEGNEA